MALLNPADLRPLDLTRSGIAAVGPPGPVPDDLLPSLESSVQALARDDRAVHVERLAARPARVAELARPLPDAVRERLGIDTF